MRQLTLITVLISVSLALECDYCVNSWSSDDCRLIKKTCRRGQVCSIEVKTTRYIYKNRSKDLKTYSMGCEHVSLCRDGDRTFLSTRGTVRSHKSCCCTDQCREADGVGNGYLADCSNAVTGAGGSWGYRGTATKTTRFLLLTFMCIGASLTFNFGEM